MLREFVSTTMIMAPARVEPNVGAALNDSISKNVKSEGQNSISIIWGYANMSGHVKVSFSSFESENELPTDIDVACLTKD